MVEKATFFLQNLTNNSQALSFIPQNTLYQSQVSKKAYTIFGKPFCMRT